MKKFFVLLLSALGLTAAAEIDTSEFIELQFDTDYQTQAYKSFKGKLTAPESGVIIEYGGIAAHTLNSKGELTMVPDWKYAGYINGKQAYEFSAQAGTTYYIYSDFVMDSGVISFSLNPGVKIIELNPAEGSVYDIASSEYVDLTANQNITIGKAVVSSGDHSAEVSIRQQNSTNYILINEYLTDWYNKNLISEGDVIKVVLSEITDGIGMPTDDIILSYKAGGKPYTLVSHEIPDPVLSWYPADDTEAKATFTFSGPVGPDPNIELCYSPIELGYEYVEKLHATVDGNTITVNLAGKLRTPEIMSPDGMDYNFIDFRLYGIKDARGQYMMANEGSVGSFQFRVPFETLPRINFAVEFTPGYGSDLADYSEIKIAYDHPDQMSFSGVTFTSGSESVVIPISELTVADGLITVAVPEAWKTKSNVIVSLADLETADGIDHSAEFSAKYNGFAVLFSNPAEGASLQALTKGRTITIDTNLSAGQQVVFSLISGTDVIYGPVAMSEKYEGQYIHAMESDVVLYTSESYKLEFRAGEAVETIAINGLSVPFEYSDLELASISPEPESTVNASDKISLRFTGIVRLTKLDDSVDFKAEPMTTTDDIYDYLWDLILPEELSSDFSIIFTATDDSGHLVKGNSGSNESTCFVFSYKALSSVLEIRTPSNNKTIIYDLSGRRTKAPVRGINIVNGQKILR